MLSKTILDPTTETLGQITHDLETLRDWLRYAVSRFGYQDSAIGLMTNTAFDPLRPGGFRLLPICIRCVVRCVYTCVVARLLWPRSSCTPRMSAPAS